MKRLILATAIVALGSTVPSDLAAQESMLSPGNEKRLSVLPGRDIRGGPVSG